MKQLKFGHETYKNQYRLASMVSNSIDWETTIRIMTVSHTFFFLQKKKMLGVWLQSGCFVLRYMSLRSDWDESLCIRSSRLWAFLSVSTGRQADNMACKELANYTLGRWKEHWIHASTFLVRSCRCQVLVSPIRVSFTFPKGIRCGFRCLCQVWPRNRVR